MLTRCLDNQQSWRILNGVEEEVGPESELLIGGDGHLSLRRERRGASLVFPCILSALQWITQGRDPLVSDSTKHMPVKANVSAKAVQLREAANVHVLITGSLHLVGGALKHLLPALSS